MEIGKLFKADAQDHFHHTLTDAPKNHTWHAFSRISMLLSSQKQKKSESGSPNSQHHYALAVAFPPKLRQERSALR